MGELNNIYNEFNEHYRSADGLARLDRDDKREPFGGCVLPTVRNENGILFLAEILLELHMSGLDMRDEKVRVEKTLSMMQVANTASYSRRPCDNNLMNSHDNIIGIVILCQLLGYRTRLKELHSWGRFHWWSFNNLNPNKLYDPRSWLLPRDQALVRLARGKFPGLVSMIWLMASIWTKSKHKRMMRLRMEIVRLAPQTIWAKGISKWLAIWWDSWGGYERFARECEEYYKDANQPYRRLVAFRVRNER